MHAGTNLAGFGVCRERYASHLPHQSLINPTLKRAQPTSVPACQVESWCLQTASAFGSLDVNAPSPSPAETQEPSEDPPAQSSDPPHQADSPSHSYRDRVDRASSPGGLAGWQAFKPATPGHAFQSAGSLPILQSALHRRSAFAQGAGVLPPSLGVTPSFEGPFPPQALILKDNSHRREAYAKGHGALPPPFSSRQRLHTLPPAASSDSDTLRDARSFCEDLAESPELFSERSSSLGHKTQLGRVVPSGRAMKQVDSFNTDMVRQSIDKANRTDTNDKHISSAGEPLAFMHRLLVFTGVV